jgi:hypothetical protein
MLIPYFPEFTPVSMDLKPEMHPRLSMTVDGVSEYTFAGLYLFRARYNYRVSRYIDHNFILSGEHDGEKFFMTPCGAPGAEILDELFRTHDYWKGVPESVIVPNRERLEGAGIVFEEDRNNFDYLYLRTDLAELVGKRFHKKKNLVNAFLNAYCPSEGPLTAREIPAAMRILDQWKAEKGEDGDYRASREALELSGELGLRGSMYYVDGKPAGWTLGESLARGRMFAIHFEKGLDSIKGLYQYINKAFAASLPSYYTHINREQDLGDDGLRQAKMTYRPVGFVKKYQGRRSA